MAWPPISLVGRHHFRRQRVSRIRRTILGVKVRVREGESLEQALKRLRKLILYNNRWPVFISKSTKRRQEFHQTKGQLQRQRDRLAQQRKRRYSNYTFNPSVPYRYW